ncbi:MAG: ABC transporter permease [Gammaproteobacteria bacterium]
MRFAAVPRPPESRIHAAAAAVLAAPFAAVLAGGALLAVLGHNPATVLQIFFWQPFTSLYGAVEVLNKTTTLALIAIGLSAGFRAGVWNIGAEGQFTVGALSGGAVALALGGGDSALPLPLMLAAGIAGGVVWASIPALLRMRFHTNEILTSLMLVYVAQLLLAYCVHGPLKNPDGYGFPQSRLFAENAVLPALLPDARLYATAFLLPAAAVAAYLFFRRSYAGFQMRVVGLAPRAARFSGYSESRAVWISFSAAGALAGLMGVCEVAGPIGQLTPSVSPGYGFTAIIVAFLGRLHPLGIIPAATLLATAQIGGENAQIALGLPVSVSGVFQGLVLFCLLAAEFLVSYRITVKK